MKLFTEPRIPLIRPCSQSIYEKSCALIPGGVNSPVRSFPDLGQTPLVIESGFGDTITDSDGYEYIDYCCSWGALIHGHAHPVIVQHTKDRIEKGSTFGTATRIEQQLAEKVIAAYPSVDKIRFVSSGTEAAMSALRLARGFTGRDLVVKFEGCYHGHTDFLLVQAGSGLANLNATSSSAGVPQASIQNTISIPFNDIEALRTVCAQHRIAAIIVEPVAANMGIVLPQPGFLETLRIETQKQGALLIFDEVITGFRLAKGGAQELFDIAPDITCFGKIIGGGFPAAAFGGRREIMDCLAPLGSVYQAGTLSGNPVAMEAGLQALKLLDEVDAYDSLKEKTDSITNPIKEFLARKDVNACIQQAGSLFTIFFGARRVDNFQQARSLETARYRAFFRYLFERGIYTPQSQYESNFVSLAHTQDHLEFTRDVILEFFD